MNNKNTDSRTSKISIDQKLFICEICQKEFFTKIHYQIHSIIHLLPEHINCHECQEGFTQILSLDKHLEIHINPTCHVCKKTFFDIDFLNEHVKNHIIEPTSGLIVQQATINDKTPIKFHDDGHDVSTSRLQNLLRCDTCKTIFSEKCHLDEHYKNQCIKKELDSDKCEELVSMTFASVDNFHTSGDDDDNDRPLSSDVLDVIKNVSSEICESTKYFTEKSEECQIKITNVCSQNLQNVKQFICEVCQKVFRNKRSLTIHSSTHSGEKAFACHLCKKKFSLHRLLNAHLQRHSARKFSCSVCQKSFVSKDKLFNHIHIHAIVKTFTCKICKMTFSEKFLLTKHRLSHYGNTCEICQKKLSSRQKLLIHQRIHSGFRPYVCKICSKKFNNWGNLYRHKLIHTGERPFKCESCEATFNRKDVLASHRLIHERHLKPDGTIVRPPKKSVPCNLCPEGYMLKSSGNSQLCIHLEKKPFKCETCDKSFTSKTNLRQHQYIHSGQTPFVCEICNKGFRQKNLLKLHHRSHSGDKPFLCETCGKKFTTKTGLQTHPCSLQNDDTAFKCEVCNKGFAFKSTFDVHTRIHTGEKPFVCDICNRKFTQKHHLKRHLQFMHGKDWASVI